MKVILVQLNGNLYKNEQKILVGNICFFVIKIIINYFLESLPIPFEKDDDFQIDFITAATVRLLCDRKKLYSLVCRT